MGLGKLEGFLANQCLLDGPLPGLAVDHHAEVFYAWREGVAAGILKDTFEVTHVDVHSDLAYFDTGRMYLRHELSWPVEARRYPREGDDALCDGNYLASAIANRWISSIEYVIGGRPECECFDDEPPYEWQPTSDVTFEDFEGSTP